MDRFAAALWHPDRPVPAGLPPGRFAIYRNNVAVALAEALAANFPAVASLVGPAFMAAAAREFIAAHPPQGPVLAEWGGDFPGWIAAFPPAAGLPWLADIARLDALCRQAFHAADAAPADAAALAATHPEDWRLRLHPAVRWMASPWPLCGIRAHALGLPPDPSEAGVAGEVLVTRPALVVTVAPAPEGTGTALGALDAGAPLAEALAGAPDPEAVLVALLVRGALTQGDAR